MKICPKCKVEYQDGYTKCSDCGETLIEYHVQANVNHQINEKGIKVIKYGLSLLFITIFEVIAVIITFEYYWTYKLSHGGVSGTPISIVHPMIWILIIVEFLVSLITIYWGSSYRDNADINKE